MPHFEYDATKSRTNKEQHGINFAEAQDLWESAHVIIPAKNVVGESRYAILGKINGKIYVAIFARRGDTIRLISCHRADKRWVKIYEQYIQQKDR